MYIFFVDDLVLYNVTCTCATCSTYMYNVLYYYYVVGTYYVTIYMYMYVALL